MIWALGTELIKAYIPALNTMKSLGDLYPETQPNESQAICAKVLSGYTIVRGGSSALSKSSDSWKQDNDSGLRNQNQSLTALYDNS